MINLSKAVLRWIRSIKAPFSDTPKDEVINRFPPSKEHTSLKGPIAAEEEYPVIAIPKERRKCDHDLRAPSELKEPLASFPHEGGSPVPKKKQLPVLVKHP